MTPCKHPQHPASMSRNTMECVRDTEQESVWACKACLEVNRVYAVQIQTKPKYRQHVRRELAKQQRLAPNPKQQRFR